MDIDTTLWIVVAGIVAFIGCGCMATRGKHGSKHGSPADCANGGCATKEVY
jgi:hypothetical protein